MIQCPVCGEKAIKSWCGPFRREGDRIMVEQHYQCRQCHTTVQQEDVTGWYRDMNKEEKINRQDREERRERGNA